MVKFEFYLSEDDVEQMETCKAEEGRAYQTFNEYAKYLIEDALQLRRIRSRAAARAAADPKPAPPDPVPESLPATEAPSPDDVERLLDTIGKIDISLLEANTKFMTPEQEAAFWGDDPEGSSPADSGE